MTRWVWLVALCLVISASAAGETEQSVSVEELLQHPEVRGAIDVVDAWPDALVDYEDVPGVSVGFVVDQDVLFAKGYGLANRSAGQAPDGDTIYSISKLFTAIGVMQERDRGVLTLRDPVGAHLPWFAIDERHADAGPARIEGLLTHSSGLPRESDFPYWVDTFDFPSREAMIEKLRDQETLYPADTRFQYSNLALTLAGEIVSATSGLPYDQYVRERILEPIGLTDTRTFFPLDLHGDAMAVGYSGRERSAERRPLPPFDTAAITPAAGFTSTVNDLARFASWQFRVLGGDDDGVLDKNTLREMQRIHWVEPGGAPNWGLGFAVFAVEGQRVVGHSGGCPGYATNFAVVPKHKIAAIALTNAADGPSGQVTNTMLKVLGGALAKAQGPVPESSGDGPDLKSYVGNYSSGVWGGENAIRIWGDQLASLFLPSDTLGTITKLRHVEGDRFVRLSKDGEPLEAVVFLRDDDGEVVGVRSHSSYAKRID